MDVQYNESQSINKLFKYICRTIHPVKYLQDHLEQSIRPDGRKFLSFRPVSVNVSSIVQADSSAIFKLGNTTAVCGIKAELATPKVDTPDHGYVVPNVELSPLCSSRFRPGPPGEQAQVLSKCIDVILNNSAALDLKDLCICKSKLVWVLQLLITDPTDDEEDLASGKFSIAIDDEDNFCYVHKPGGIPISANLFSKGLEMARTRAKSVRSVINAAISTLAVHDMETDT
ncbi:hypothetical protein DMN91_012789 [Ooceraea biroi]|uniref:Ribosomal RNA-processing protein 43 n=1 Tax=Ooceraea biroi TaxID=2015173 RepID=A0A3L8D330_OOCBI|nr:hypothetical protein DMN91_012789 [Ooceraea biroi]